VLTRIEAILFPEACSRIIFISITASYSVRAARASLRKARWREAARKAADSPVASTWSAMGRRCLALLLGQEEGAQGRVSSHT